MTHPLIQRLYDDYGYPEVTLQTHDDFISQPGIAVLFFAGDPKLFRDTTDIAGKALQQHYGFAAWPSLVFLRDGGYLGCLTGIQNWSEYLQAISDLVVADVQQPQGLGIPVVSA
jgi:hydrogenase-1 operon protein HyaE